MTFCMDLPELAINSSIFPYIIQLLEMNAGFCYDLLENISY